VDVVSAPYIVQFNEIVETLLKIHHELFRFILKTAREQKPKLQVFKDMVYKKQRELIKQFSSFVVSVCTENLAFYSTALGKVVFNFQDMSLEDHTHCDPDLTWLSVGIDLEFYDYVGTKVEVILFLTPTISILYDNHFPDQSLVALVLDFISNDRCMVCPLRLLNCSDLSRSTLLQNATGKYLRCSKRVRVVLTDEEFLQHTTAFLSRVSSDIQLVTFDPLFFGWFLGLITSSAASEKGLCYVFC